MKNREIMSEHLVSCRSNDTLSTAAHLMWVHDCGAIPVTDDEGQIVGMITDRDICMATYINGSAPQSLRVESAMAKEVHAVRAEEPIEATEKLMRSKQIRRVPVLDGDNRPIGLLTLTDLVRHAATARGNNGEEHEMLRTIAAINRPRPTSIEKARPAALLRRTPS